MATKRKRIPRGLSVRKVTFGGREWTVARVPNDEAAGPLRATDLGHIEPNRNVILFRKTAPDTDLITIIHELIHFALPKATEAEVEHAGDLLKDSIEAFGVDLSPMLRGFKKL